VAQARAAERLGYERVWLFDSPSLYTDIWVAVTRIVDATSSIGVGTGVAIPAMRHPMATAAAIAGVEEAAPGRLVACFGTGFTGRLTMGQPPMRWADLARYVRQVRALLAGEVVVIDGGVCQMMHAPGFAPERPIRTPLWVAPSGPKGFAAAHDLGVEGVMVVADPPEGERDWAQCSELVYGTVVRPGEDHTSRRLMEAGGPGYTTTVHGIWTYAKSMVDQLPGGAEWGAAIAAERPPEEAHLIVHQGHLCYITDRDRPLVEAAGKELLTSGWTASAAEIGARFDSAAAVGVSEVVYIPAGPDIAGELEAFAAAAQTG
jgi:5,10-methylenetetrahydromethanopterin reductase